MEGVSIANLQNQKVSELPDTALHLDVRLPWDVEGKFHLVQYIYGTLLERANGVELERRKNPVTLSKASLVPLPQTITPIHNQWACANNKPPWIGHFYEHGWAVVKLVDYESDMVRKAFLDFLASCNENFKQADQSSWQERYLPTLDKDSVKHYGAQLNWVWYTRYAVAYHFACLWDVQPNELLTSFETPFISLPEKTKRILTEDGIQEVEQDEFRQSFRQTSYRFDSNMTMVEGHVFLDDCGPTDGGVVVIEGSVAYSQNYLQRHPSEGLSVTSSTNMNDPQVSQMQRTKICCQKGDLVLVDSRAISCRIKGREPYLGVKVSMSPKAFLINSDKSYGKHLTIRQQYYGVGRVTGPHTHGPMFRLMPPIPTMFEWTQSYPPTHEISSLSELGTDLVGNERSLQTVGWLQ